jgi:hypothetical protein
MSDHGVRAAELLLKALRHEEGDERIAICEDAVTEADLSGHFELRFTTREELVRATIFGGEPEKAIVAFSWLLAHFEQRPPRVSAWSILWKYKWILSRIHEFPQISKARIFEMFDDFEAHSIRAGYGLYAIHNFRYRFEQFCGNRESAIELFRKMMDLPEDGLSNCSTCIIDEAVSFALYCGDDDRAIELAKPIFDGELQCSSVPHRTYARLLLPLHRSGKTDDARNYQRAGYRLIRDNKAFLDRVSQHLIYLVATGQLDSGLALFKKHVPWLAQTRNSYDHFLFHRAAWLLFDAQAEQSGKPLRINLPQSVPYHSADGSYDASTLSKWHEEKAAELGRRFDARNETDCFAQTMNETRQLKNVRRLAHL